MGSGAGRTVRLCPGASSVCDGKRYVRSGKWRTSCCSVKPPRSAVSSSDSLRMRTKPWRGLAATIFRRQALLRLGREGQGKAQCRVAWARPPPPAGRPVPVLRWGCDTPSPQVSVVRIWTGLRRQDSLALPVRVGFLEIQGEEACPGKGPPHGEPTGDICEAAGPAVCPQGPCGRRQH